jgi:hypothetical protein
MGINPLVHLVYNLLVSILVYFTHRTHAGLKKYPPSKNAFNPLWISGKVRTFPQSHVFGVRICTAWASRDFQSFMHLIPNPQVN